MIPGLAGGFSAEKPLPGNEPRPLCGRFPDALDRLLQVLVRVCGATHLHQTEGHRGVAGGGHASQDNERTVGMGTRKRVIPVTPLPWSGVAAEHPASA